MQEGEENLMMETEKEFARGRKRAKRASPKEKGIKSFKE